MDSGLIALRCPGMTMRNDIPTRNLNPAAPRHDRGAEQDDDDGEKLATDHGGDQPEFFGTDRRHRPTFSAARHDRNSRVGMIDNSPTAMNTDNLAMKAWLWK